MPQEALSIMDPFCNPRRPADPRLAAREYCSLVLRSRAHWEAGRRLPFCLHLDASTLAGSGNLSSCLQWMSSITLQRVEIAGPLKQPLTQQQAAALGSLLGVSAPAVCARVEQLVVEAEQPGELFNAGKLHVAAASHRYCRGWPVCETRSARGGGWMPLPGASYPHTLPPSPRSLSCCRRNARILRPAAAGAAVVCQR